MSAFAAFGGEMFVNRPDDLQFADWAPSKLQNMKHMQNVTVCAVWKLPLWCRF